MSFYVKHTALSLAVMAASTMATPAALAADSQSFQLEKVVITAQKKAESLQDTPISLVAGQLTLRTFCVIAALVFTRKVLHASCRCWQRYVPLWLRNEKLIGGVL